MPTPKPLTYANDAAPAVGGEAVTLSDSVDFITKPCRALWVGSGGTIKMTTRSGDVITLTNVPSGYLLPIACTRVWSSVTTASSIVALY